MKIDRLVSIIMILLDKKHIGVQELADMFEVSPRTIYCDINTINMPSIPIRGASGVGADLKAYWNIKSIERFFDFQSFQHDTRC